MDEPVSRRGTGKKFCIACATAQLLARIAMKSISRIWQSAGTLDCTVCRHKYPVPFRVCVNGFDVIAGKGKFLSEYHLSHGSDNDRVASFVESKKNPGVFGLKNETQLIWSVEYPGRGAMPYEPGKVVTVIPDTCIHIGNKTIEIKK